jgi:hypothetical protein
MSGDSQPKRDRCCQRKAEAHAGVLTIICSCSAPLGRAWRLTAILPAMTLAKTIEIMRIHCVAGLTGDCAA